MKLYTYPAAPNPRRVHVFLAEKGVDIATVNIDLAAGEQLGEAFRAVNPLCTVPALVTDEGATLTQVNAICDYLEALYPEPPLLGRTPLEKGLVREWCHRVFVEGISAIADVFRNGNPTFAHRAMPGPLDLEQVPALVDRGLLRLDAFWKTLDAHLAGREYMVGDAFSVADIDAAIACDFARWVRKSIPEECAELRRWHAAMRARPSFGNGK
jgi:glutathione S-transferase